MLNSRTSIITPLSKDEQVPPGKNVVVSGIITADNAIYIALPTIYQRKWCEVISINNRYWS